MNVEIINVGTELLLGEIVNTNAPYLLKLCRNFGFNVYYQSVVGDNPDRLKEMLRVAFERGADCVITTGGLGPTQDDLTKEMSAEFFGLPLVYNEEEAKKVRDKCMFLNKDGIITENNFKQAYYPENAYILDNPVGTANGCVMFKDKWMIVNLPGPPKELTYIVDHALKQFFEPYREEKIYTTDILTMGMGESKVDTLLGDLEESQKEVSLAMYAGEGKVRIRLAVKALSREEADRKMKPVFDEVSLRMKDYIIEGNSIEKALKKIMVPVTFEGELEIPAFFEPYLSDKPEVVVKTKVKHEKIGDIVTVSFNDEESIDIMTLDDYHYNKQRLDARILLNLYLYLKHNSLTAEL